VVELVLNESWNGRRKLKEMRKQYAVRAACDKKERKIETRERGEKEHEFEWRPRRV
jgi:hypothetical protein